MLNLLNVGSDFKFLTRSWSIVHDQSNPNYSVGNEIIYIAQKCYSLIFILLL